jgi:hypothetical protein
VLGAALESRWTADWVAIVGTISGAVSAYIFGRFEYLQPRVSGSYR